jgi:phosphoribosyl 1,2-cyclic phosphodiesterase
MSREIPMKVRVLGCSGTIAQGCRTTSFLVDHNLLVDAGTGVGELTLDEMAGIDHVLLTHSHLDHVAALPLMIDAIAGRRSTPLQVHALQATIDALKAHIFNNVIWPDFSVIPTPAAPLIQFQVLTLGQTLQLAGKQVEVLPAVHTVPAIGYAISAGRGCWVFTGDTEHNPALWARLNQLNVAMLVIETAFSNRERDLARRSLHLSPANWRALHRVVNTPFTSPTPSPPKPNGSWPRSRALTRRVRRATTPGTTFANYRRVRCLSCEGMGALSRTRAALNWKFSAPSGMADLNTAQRAGG